MTRKPELSFWQIWNMCFGFLGIQFGFALQNANVSRIFQTLGADVGDIPALWIAAPFSGLLVQPVIGYLSDRTWTRLGRRRPYFLIGAVLTTLALLCMPNSPVLWVAAGLLWIMDASINVSMEPFRAFVGDQLPPRQRPQGYAMQSFFIGLGSVVASLLPWLLAKLGVSNVADEGAIPHTVKYAFYLGGVVLLGSVLWTVLTTREYPPGELEAFTDSPTDTGETDVSGAWRSGVALIVAGIALLAVIWHYALEKELYLLGGGLVLFGALFSWLSVARTRGMLRQVMGDLYGMPETMRRLAVVQFFSWFALFALWIYTTAAVTSVHYGTTDTHSALYNEGANWVGVLFGAYNGFAAVAAAVIPWMVRRWGLRTSHLANCWLGGAGLLSFLVIRDPHWLLLSMVGVGFAWASILSLPYALLSDNLPATKMGVYMGIFNFFIVIPQLMAASVLGLLLRLFFHGQPIWALAMGGASLVIAGLCTLRVAESQE
ncbi:maltose/moltooligosaccharide transporter [Dyella jiangningensis]|uniref:MFS transporter n=1 Tax=Dyella sp. AtDHG13 TaxID=1938897 RepID=UPI00088DD05B|nr:MFS transporter [Dyella sp. AtDHG13]PXV59188.1 maltose/moltooligosaccharide transporter [Dyella sp. AtDHG13]SDK25299.1 maltose/moltooligosaccharide transporter [Dyella jiangningensis]